MLTEREKLRKEGKYDEADEIRKKIENLGYKIEDTGKGSRVKKVKSTARNVG